MKLVTGFPWPCKLGLSILIHTSVKLVTSPNWSSSPQAKNFNPHEREARDYRRGISLFLLGHFNPHEREARDGVIRDGSREPFILIHTSVKLVTPSERVPLLNSLF